MAYSTTITDLELTKWSSKYWMEYVAETGMSEFMGASPMAIFQTYRELIDGGKDHIVALLGSLKGRGVGAGLLTGAEERFDQFSMRLRPVWRRQAVVVKKSEQQKSVLDIFNAQKDVLKLWSTDDLRDRMVEAFSVMVTDDTRYNEDEGLENQVPYAEATAAQRNTWVTNNSTRALFGVTEANYSAVMATALATIDTTNDMWSSTIIDIAKGMARRRDRSTGRRAIRPFRNGKDGREYFVLFVGTKTMGILRADTNIKTSMQNSLPREREDNPLFQGGDLLWNGVIIREIPELPTLVDVGASSADVEAGYLCGAQALIISWGQDPKGTKRTDDDYQFIRGVGTEELRAVDKTFFGATAPIQHGIVSIFAGVAA